MGGVIRVVRPTRPGNKGTSADPHVLVHGGGYIFKLTQLMVVDRVRLISALQTERKVSHYC